MPIFSLSRRQRRTDFGVARADGNTVPDPPHNRCLLDSGLLAGHTPIELECNRIQQERIALWRSGKLEASVVEVARRSTENGWSYDCAA
jgi:hypothetical protein